MFAASPTPARSVLLLFFVNWEFIIVKFLPWLQIKTGPGL